MSIPISALKLATHIQGEFGGTAPTSLSEYYRGGARVPANLGDLGYGLIAVSGPISMGTFRGQTNVFYFNDVVTSSIDQYHFVPRASAAGWDGIKVLIATITVNPGVFVYSSSTAAPALQFDYGSFPAGSSISLINHGYIIGAGGAGGAGGSVHGAAPFVNGGAGGQGGPALFLPNSWQVSITNNGIIGGGGGGGGGGSAQLSKFNVGGAGGGGGGGLVFGVGGVGGTDASFSNPGGTGASGGLAVSGATAGGAGFLIPSVQRGGDGGAGGTPGQPGSPGIYGDWANDYAWAGHSEPGAGGASGYAVLNIANAIWTFYGSVLGPTA